MLSFNLLDNLKTTPELYPTKESWTLWVSNYAQSVIDDAMLNRIANGVSAGTDEQIEKLYNSIIHVGNLAWEIHVNGGLSE